MIMDFKIVATIHIKVEIYFIIAWNSWVGLADGEDITTDIIDGDFTDSFMKCRLFHGSQTYHKAAKIICGDFSESWESGELLHFAFKVTNPSVSPQISIPFFIYSMDLDNMYKSNFNTV